MLSASFFSLKIPALDAAELCFGAGAIPAGIAVVSILAGMGLVAWLNEILPHEHFASGREGPDSAELRRISLFIIAITIHSFPEGMAVSVGFGAHGPAGGLPPGIGIGLQNLPEGLAVAVALVGEGYGRLRAWSVAALTGLIEPVGGVLGVAMISVSGPVLPRGLAFAAGAMLDVMSHEIIPETHRFGQQNSPPSALASVWS